MGPGRGGGPGGAPGRNGTPPPEGSRRGEVDDHALRIWILGSGAAVLSGLRAGDFYVREIRVSSGAIARSDPLCRGAVGTKNPHGDFESNLAGRGGTTPTGE